MKFGGPAVTVATTIFDMVMADSRHDRCVALAAGAAGGLGSWGGAKVVQLSVRRRDLERYFSFQPLPSAARFSRDSAAAS